MRYPVAIIAVLTGAQPAAAGTATATMTVSASVAAACRVSASPLVFGRYDGRQLDATSAIAATCSNGANFAVGVDSGGGAGATPARRQLIGAGEDVRSGLAYAIYVDVARSEVWGNSVGVDTVAAVGTGGTQSIPVYGRIAGNQSPGGGNYQDAVQVVITF